MLLALRIENFALIDQLELNFHAGLNVLTGETGAGKSIILDAIDAALGGKVTSRFIRTGSQRAIVEATFRLSVPVRRWLHEQQIDLLDEESFVCSREMTVSDRGSLRSRSRINGIVVNRQQMEQLRPQLVEITAQGQTVELMIPTRQRELLDLYGGESLLRQKAEVAKAYEAYQSAKRTFDRRRESEQQRLQRLDLIQYQAQELEKAALEAPDELTQLEQERDRLLHVVELQQLSYQAYQILYQNDSDESPAVADLLGQAEALLGDMNRYDSQLEPLLEIVQTALTQIVEAGQQIHYYGESLEADPERLIEVDTRIHTLKQICRKYGPTLADAIAYAQNLQAELVELTDGSQSLEELEQLTQTTYDRLLKVSRKLSESRRKAATQLEKHLIAELKPLAMDKVQFQCRLTPIAPSINGCEQVEYYFSPNPGESLKPLSETASGGEMSRFLLALKACFSRGDRPTQTLVFDEIDTGVSGRVANAIGAKLHQLAQHHQVLCVTHQPLVAAMADAHFRVEKQFTGAGNGKRKQKTASNGQLTPETGERTVVRVSVLDDHQTRREELAQLAGGHSAEDAIAFAESLLTQASQHRQNNGTAQTK